MTRDEITERVRGRRGQASRERFLRQHPLCAEHLKRGRFVQAEQVDHIVRLTDGGSDDDGNKQALCRECHTAKTLRERGCEPKQSIGSDGYPA